jgi:hypothetical protein
VFGAHKVLAENTTRRAGDFLPNLHDLVGAQEHGHTFAPEIEQERYEPLDKKGGSGEQRIGNGGGSCKPNCRCRKK